jgi:LPS-assembly lipoprotein
MKKGGPTLAASQTALPVQGAAEPRGAPAVRRRSVLAAGAAALATGCGFQLRQAPDFVFDAVVMNAPVSSPLAAELSRSLASNGRVQVLPPAALSAPAAAAAPVAGASAPLPAASAPAVLPRNTVVFDLPQELREKIVVGLNASGQVREFQLRSRIRFRVRNPQGTELIPETELVQQRDITFNEASVLAKESEESLLYRDMQTDLVQQLMRRLAALKSL